MKPTERILEVDSTLTGERVGMSIDTAAMSHIMSVLTDLYSDPELAVLREYSTNALDAHRDAGVTRPIEVTLPTPLAPFLRIRDYGVGLTAEDIRDIYSRYGTSTKRDSDDVVGMLGLGAKSGLTYADQFTLVGTKDGRTVQVSVSRDEDGGGSMTIVSDELTDEPNGVEVIIPAKRDNGFESKARDFFRFWAAGTVLINGAPPKRITDAADTTWLVPDKLVVRDREALGMQYSDQPGWVVMGNVPYPIPNTPGSRPRYVVIAFVDIGDVNFTPSREALQMTKRTRETLERIQHDVTRELTRAVQERVTTASTPAEALALAQQGDRWGVKLADLKYRGRVLPGHFARPSTDFDRGYLVVGGSYYGPYYARKTGDQYRTLPPHAENRVWFTGFKSADFSKPKRDKFDAWLAQEGLDRPKQIVFVDELTPDERYWLKGAPVYDWTPVQAIKVARDTVGGWRSRPSGSYHMRVAGQWADRLAEEIPTGDLVYVPGGQRAAYYDDQVRRKLPEDVTVVSVPRNRLDKFLRDFPHAITVAQYLARAAEAWASAQDQDELFAAWYQQVGEGHVLNGLDHERVDDPALARAIQLQNDKAGQRLRTTLGKYAANLKRPDGLPEGNPFAQYPLLANGYYGLDKEHIYIYVNAAYAASRQKEEAAA